MTSNIGAQEIARNTPLGFAVSDDETGITYEDMKNRIMGELKKVFRPEFLNRIDEVVVFHKLARDEIKTIVELLLRRVRQSLAERELQLELTEDAKDLLVEKGWDPSMGARPLRRAIQRFIEDPLADFVLRAELPAGATVVVERGGEGEEEDVNLTVIEAKKVPAAVGGGRAEEGEPATRRARGASAAAASCGGGRALSIEGRRGAALTRVGALAWRRAQAAVVPRRRRASRSCAAGR